MDNLLQHIMPSLLRRECIDGMTRYHARGWSIAGPRTACGDAGSLDRLVNDRVVSCSSNKYLNPLREINTLIFRLLHFIISLGNKAFPSPLLADCAWPFFTIYCYQPDDLKLLIYIKLGDLGLRFYC